MDATTAIVEPPGAPDVLFLWCQEVPTEVLKRRPAPQMVGASMRAISAGALALLRSAGRDARVAGAGDYAGRSRAERSRRSSVENGHEDSLQVKSGSAARVRPPSPAVAGEAAQARQYSHYSVFIMFAIWRCASFMPTGSRLLLKRWAWRSCRSTLTTREARSRRSSATPPNTWTKKQGGGVAARLLPQGDRTVVWPGCRRCAVVIHRARGRSRGVCHEWSSVRRCS